jgi:hypothetical protein
MPVPRLQLMMKGPGQMASWKLWRSETAFARGHVDRNFAWTSVRVLLPGPTTQSLRNIPGRRTAEADGGNWAEERPRGEIVPNGQAFARRTPSVTI